ncbi:MAG: tRNA pseudouridine(55) synthase TruB [Anaerolineae bacterium]|nr:tRNA pseudouridine(55) synthase TruB [Gemmatimonadaceae bacterium]
MRTRSIDGVLLADKAAGMSSHDVVLLVRRVTGEKRVGHAGTLDPFATGLLVLLLGHATRLLPYIDGEPKVYEATIRFGIETDTDDLLGATIRTSALPSDAVVRAAISGLTGMLDQVPPNYSAKRVEGRRAYEAARAGELLTLAPARVRVDEWQVGAWRGADLDVVITCGAGTYIRALARDLGRSTESAAHLVALRRTQSGPFRVDNASSAEVIASGNAPVLGARAALVSRPTQQLENVEVARIVRGLEVDARVAGTHAALVNEKGELVAVAERRNDRWQPRVVLRRG